MSKIIKLFLSVFFLILFSAVALPVYAVPVVKILLPVNGFTTDKNTLDVQVYFKASANNKKDKLTGNVKTIILKMANKEVTRYEKPPKIKEGTKAFTLDISTIAEGRHILQAFAYQGQVSAGLEGKYDPGNFIV